MKNASEDPSELPRALSRDEAIARFTRVNGHPVQEISTACESRLVPADSLRRHEELPATSLSTSRLGRKTTVDASDLLVPNQVEDLLDESAALLERCLADREEWDNLRQKQLDSSTQLVEYYKLHEVHEREIRDSFYELEMSLSGAELEAKRLELAASVAESKELGERLQRFFSEQEVADEVARRGQRARNQGFPYYNEGHQPLQWGTPKRTRIDHIQQDEEENSRRLLALEAWAARLEAAREKAAALAQELRVNADSVRHAWDTANRVHRFDRMMATKTTMDMRAQQFIEPGGVLEFTERLGELEARYWTDYDHALQRLRIAEHGLAMVYGASELPPLFIGRNGSPTIDEATLWLRSTLHWLRARASLDITFSHSVSVRQTLGASEWQRLLGTGSVELTLERDAFPSLSCIRLVSVQCGIESQTDGWGRFSLDLELPDKATYLYPDGSERIHDQRRCCVRLGQVGRALDSRAPEEARGRRLVNLSPIGTWRLRLSPSSTSGKSRAELENLTLLLRVVGQSD